MEFISFAAFLITLRETMEAALIIGILLAYLTKTENQLYKKHIWAGTGLAILVSIIGAVAFQVLLGGFEGAAEKLFEGIIMITAASVLTWMIIWMFKNSSNIKYELHDKMDTAINNERKYALVFLAFVAVLREGIETVLFMTGISANEPLSAVLVSGSVGIMVAVVLAVLLFRGSVELNLKQFFNVTSVILIFFAAGLFAHGIHEFQELNWFGIYGVANAPYWNVPLWDWSGWLSDGEGIGAILRALLGYQDKPTLIEIVAYVFYWIVMGLMYMGINIRVKSSKATQVA